MVNIDTILYGKDTTERVVNVEPITSTKAIVYIRNEEDKVISEIRDYNEWFLTDDINLAMAYSEHPAFKVEQLHGNNEFKYRIKVLSDDYETFKDKFNIFNNVYGSDSKMFRHKNLLRLSKEEICRIDLGVTEGKGMKWNDQLIAGFDIETTGIDANNEKIFLIVVVFNRMVEFDGIKSKKFTIYSDNDCEVEILRKFQNLILYTDPDIMAAHNGFNFDLFFIINRAFHNNLDDFNLGRYISKDFETPPMKVTIDGGKLKVGETPEDFTKVEIFGRHIIDTLHAAKRRNAVSRDMLNFKLKYLEEYFNIKPEDRVEIDGSVIYETWKKDRDLVLKYCYDDVYSVLKISNILMGAPFALAKMLPLSFQTLSYCGSSKIWNNLMIREYMRRGYSIPKPQPNRKFVGGLVDIFVTGVIKNVYKFDFSSLYPSLIIGKKIKPKTDILNIFVPIEEQITEMRLNIKNNVLKKLKKGTPEYDTANAEQEALKIIINSAFGYLGYRYAYFNDYDGAENVTVSGRTAIKHVMDMMEAEDCVIIEVDTDGILFSPPEKYNDIDKIKEYAKDLTERLNKIVNWGLNLSYDGRWKSIYSYGMKNYALYYYDEDVVNDKRVKIKGGTLNASNKQKFGLNFLKNALLYIFEGKYQELKDEYLEIFDSIVTRKMAVTELIKGLKMKYTVDQYLDRLNDPDINTNRQAHMELLIGRDHNYRIGDKIYYYNNGTTKNAKDVESYFEDHPTEKVKCDNCNGSGEKIYKKTKKVKGSLFLKETVETQERCRSCKGSGTKPLKVKKYKLNCKLAEDADSKNPDYNVNKYLDIFYDSYVKLLENAFSPDDFKNIFSEEPLKSNVKSRYFVNKAGKE